MGRNPVGTIALALLLCLPTQDVAATDAADQCVKLKANAVGKKAKGLLNAMADNISRKSDAKLSASISKARSRFTRGFAKAESKGGCAAVGDALPIADHMDLFVLGIVREVSGVTMPQPCGEFLLKLGGGGSGDGQFISPHGTAVDDNGNVYVVDKDKHRIQKFTSTGAFITAWGTFCALNTSSGCVDPDGGGPLELGDGQFEFPTHVAVDGSDYVYVTDTGNRRVQKFTSTGTFLNKWGSVGSGDGEFDVAGAIAVDGSGDVYVADVGSERIQKFTSSGTFITKWGSLCIVSSGIGCVDPDDGGPLELGDGQFSGPVGLGVDPNGDVYVADKFNDRVQKFTSTGGFITKWEVTPGPSLLASDLAIDGNGDVYVSRAYRIRKFTSAGAFIAQWGSRGTGIAQFLSIDGIAADANGDVYVADHAWIQKFSCPLSPSASGAFVDSPVDLFE